MHASGSASPHDPTSSNTSGSLLLRAKKGEADAWMRLTELYGPMVYQWVRRMGLQPNDAADVVQEVFVSVLRNLTGFRSNTEHSTFRGWLWIIARNQVRLFFRKSQARTPARGGSDATLLLQQLPHAEPAPESEALQLDDAESQRGLLQRALRLIRRDFGEPTWQAFWKLSIEERNATEVAVELGLSPAAVRQAKYRVLCRLREVLQPDME